MMFFYREPKHNAKRPRFERHDQQIHDYRDGHQLEIVTRSALGLASVYNMLPPEIVEKRSVNMFQKALQDYAKDCAHRAVHQWQDLFTSSLHMHSHPLIKERFGESIGVSQEK